MVIKSEIKRKEILQDSREKRKKIQKKRNEAKKMKRERNENDPVEKCIIDCNSLSTNRTFPRSCGKLACLIIVLFLLINVKYILYCNYAVSR